MEIRFIISGLVMGMIGFIIFIILLKVVVSLL